jgi:hypothetical protein
MWRIYSNPDPHGVNKKKINKIKKKNKKKETII